jgi:two-component system sensor histidine kinase KdpD
MGRDGGGPRRGRLKIFFGACAGVGKTCAMLAAAQAERAQGRDVVVGVVEAHGRAQTQALADGLERLAQRQAGHRDRVLPAFDLDAALSRHPGLILMDELAHSNLAGARHPKRWQDVAELQDAGIDVWSTMNVPHLEGLNDDVGNITGVRVRETMPDRVFDTADEVVIVDLPPDDLLQSLRDGKVYLPSQAERAGRNFFRKGNLIALRELALRRTADRVDGEVLRHWRLAGRGASASPVWGNRDSVLACLGPGEHHEKTVRSAAGLTAELGSPWHAVYVETPALQRLPEAVRHGIFGTLGPAGDSGARTAGVRCTRCPAC